MDIILYILNSSQKHSTYTWQKEQKRELNL